MIEYRCSCGKWFNLTDDLAGKKVECCFCSAVGIVKGRDPQAAPASSAAPARVTMPASGGPLASFGELFGAAWDIYKQKVLTLLGITLISVLLFILSFSVVALAGLLGKMMAGLKTLLMAAGGLGSLALGLFILSWTSAAYFRAISVPDSGAMESLRRTKGIVWGYLLFLFLWGFLTMGGFFLLIIPGILFMVWFAFSPFIYLEEDAGGLGALMRSREYVKGYWWPAALRLLGVWLLYTVISAIPFVGQVIGFILAPFLFIHMFVLYKDLKRVKGSALEEPSKKAKTGVVVTGLVGFIALPLTLVLIGGAAMMGVLFKAMTMINWQKMKNPAVISPMQPGSGTGSMQDGSGSSQGSGMQDMKPTPTLYVYALNYKGKALFNGEKFYEFEGEPDMNYNMSGGGMRFKEGTNVVEVEYEPKPSSNDFMKPEIKIEAFVWDWNSKQKNTLHTFVINDASAGSKKFEFEWKP